MKIGFVRGAFLNKYEGQNYEFLNKRFKLTGIASLFSLHDRFRFPVIRLPSLYDFLIPNFVANRVLGDAQNLFGLKKFVSRFDLLHTADPHYYYSYQLAKLRKSGKIRCLIATCWETIPFNSESAPRKKYIKRFTMSYIDHFLCYTERAKDCLISEGVSPQKISVVRLGVDLDRFQNKNVESKEQKYRSKIRILFVGRQVYEKGIDDIERVIKRIDNAELMITSNIPYEKMPEKYQQADIFVMPSRRTKTWEEQYGMSLVEAMASKLPIVAYNSGAIPEILGKAGIVVEEGNTLQLFKTLKRVINSRSLKEKLGRMGRKRAELMFDAHKTAKKLEKLYETLYRNSYKK